MRLTPLLACAKGDLGGVAIDWDKGAAVGLVLASGGYPDSPEVGFTISGLGSLDDAPFELRPEAEIWIKRREPWIHAVEAASQHRENRH